jgi:hypothetical protein
LLNNVRKKGGLVPSRISCLIFTDCILVSGMQNAKNIQEQAYSILNCRKVQRAIFERIKRFCGKKNYTISSGVALGGNWKGFWTREGLELRQTTYLCLIYGTGI